MIKNDPRWIEIDATGEQTGSKYFGKFCVKPFLTHSERRDAQVLADRYNLGIDRPDIRSFHVTLAFLRFFITEVDRDTSWWKNDGLDLFDEEPVWELTRAISKIRDEINPPKTEKADEVQG